MAGGNGSRGSPGRVGYVLKKFPVLSETFILNELLALEAQGVPLHIFALERPNDPRFHDDLPKLKARVAYLPDFRTLLGHHRRVARAAGKRYLRTLSYAVSRGRPRLLWRFHQSCYVANEALRLGLCHLHAHFANRPATVAHLASRIAGIPFSFTAHAADIFKDRVDAAALREKMGQARFVVTVSDFNKEYLEREAPAKLARIVRVRNGIDLERFSPNGAAPPSPFTVLCVARLVEKKGLPLLIESCGQLRDRGIALRLWIVGKGRERPQLEALIRRLKLKEVVELVGPCNQGEVRDRYRAAHLYVLPCVVGSDGNRDGLPVSIVEALACGLPVISTPVTGIPEVVRHGENGLLVPPGDPRALAAAIEELHRDPLLYAKLRQNARTSVAERYDLRETARELHRLLTERES
jgi:glycosyltransferase involved in cell wall biosynthesis